MSNYTIRDIAKMVGVSTGTVSRVLNNADNVDPEIYDRTMAAIKKTNYTPGSKGRKPGSKNISREGKATNVISVVSTRMSGAWEGSSLWMKYMEGVEKACRERDFHMIMYFANPLKSDREVMGELMERSSGCLWKSSGESTGYFRKLCANMPVVGFGAYDPLQPVPQVALDDYSAGVVATEKLIKMGHTRIAFVNPESHHKMFVARGQGYVGVMKHHGLFDPAMMFEVPTEENDERIMLPQSTPPDMGVALKAFLEVSPRPTAVIFANDWAAAGFYRTCKEHGVSIPDEFSVVGIDTTDSMCELLVPRLSSVAMPFSKVAYFAAMKLIDMISGIGSYQQNEASVQYLPGVFYDRESTRQIQM